MSHVRGEVAQAPVRICRTDHFEEACLRLESATFGTDESFHGSSG